MFPTRAEAGPGGFCAGRFPDISVESTRSDFADAPFPSRTGMSSADSIGNEIDAIFKPLIEEKKFAGIAVGIISLNTKRTFGYGRTNLESGTAPSGDTIFEIGSITKVFTGLALGDMAVKGAAGIDDPVKSLLPYYAQVPQYHGQAVTLRHLATHTSSLPRMPSNFTPIDESNPYADYTERKIFTFLSSYRLSSAPGTAFEYSNLGAALLGWGLAHKEGKNYEDMVISRICSVLGMTDTRITLSADQQRRSAQGYSTYGVVAKPWTFDVFAGAGALRSTVDDMLVFISANIGLNSCPLSEAISLSHEPHHNHAHLPADFYGIGLGWFILKDDTNTAIWHNGGTGGYRSMLAFDKNTQKGVIILSNTSWFGDNSFEKAAFRILKLDY